MRIIVAALLIVGSAACGRTVTSPDPVPSPAPAPTPPPAPVPPTEEPTPEPPKPNQWTLTVRVMDKANKTPIVGAVVSVADSAPHPNAGRTATTDAFGKAELLNMVESGLTVNVTANGYIMASKSFGLTSSQELNFELEKVPPPAPTPTPSPTPGPAPSISQVQGTWTVPSVDTSATTALKGFVVSGEKLTRIEIVACGSLLSVPLPSQVGGISSDGKFDFIVLNPSGGGGTIVEGRFTSPTLAEGTTYVDHCPSGFVFQTAHWVASK